MILKACKQLQAFFVSAMSHSCHSKTQQNSTYLDILKRSNEVF